jgi:hypothetical protein
VRALQAGKAAVEERKAGGLEALERMPGRVVIESARGFYALSIMWSLSTAGRSWSTRASYDFVCPQGSRLLRNCGLLRVIASARRFVVGVARSRAHWLVRAFCPMLVGGVIQYPVWCESDVLRVVNPRRTSGQYGTASGERHLAVLTLPGDARVRRSRRFSPGESGR